MFRHKTRIIGAIAVSVVVLGSALIINTDLDERIFGTDVLSFVRESGGEETETQTQQQYSEPLSTQNTEEGAQGEGAQTQLAPIGTTTEVLFDNFLEAYQAQGSLGGQLSEETRQDLSASFSEKLRSSDISRAYAFYAEADLSVVPQSEAANTAYHSVVSDLISKYSADYPKDPVELLQEAAETQNTALAGELRDYADAYHAIARDLADVGVPSSAAEAHLSMTNAYFMLGQAITNMTHVFEDPLRAFIGIAQYERAQVQLIQSADAVSTATTQ